MQMRKTNPAVQLPDELSCILLVATAREIAQRP